MLQEITPWEVKGGVDGKIDYEKLSRDVSCFYQGSIKRHINLHRFMLAELGISFAVWLLSIRSGYCRQVRLSFFMPYLDSLPPAC